MNVHTLEVLEWKRIQEFLVKRCSGPMGRRVAVALEPEVDAPRIRLAVTQTDELRALLNSGADLPLGGLIDPADIFARSEKENRPFEPRELASLMAALRRTRDLVRCVEQNKSLLIEIGALISQFIDTSDLVDLMDRIVEPPDAIKDNASPLLLELHQKSRAKEEEIRDALRRFVENSEVRAALQAPNPTIRNGRWVLAVKLDMKGRVRGIVHDQSQKGSTVFIEPASIVPMTNRLRELQAQISNEVSRILWQVTRDLRTHKNRIIHTTNILAWLDFTQSKAQFSKDFRMNSPEFAADGVLRMIGARHPLLVESAKGDDGFKVVPLDIRLREGFRILVVTGPNTGGKTVTLKTVGLLQLMYQAGMHVPAEVGTRMPVFKTIHADIGDEQSISQSLSTFSGHISNIAKILENCGRRSLVLLDELGAGTDPAEGAALGRAILESLREKRVSGVVTTHLGSLKEYAYQHAEVENASVAFDKESMRPTYELLIGQPGNSNALNIAGRYGMSDEILDRARKELAANEERPEHEMIQKLQESRQDLEATRKVSEKHLLRSKNLAKSAEEKQRHLEKKSRRINNEAEGVIDVVLKELRVQLAPLLRQLGNVPKPLKATVEKIEEILLDTSKGTSLADRRRQYIATLKKQDEIYVPRLGQKCRIRKFHRTDEKITVMMGSMTMEIAYEDVGIIDTPLSE
ncbi:MAG: DNA mismatch repair protein MutS2 [Planctomycetota bacterium]|jgi:DNA mismatch repair protein MutS2